MQMPQLMGIVNVTPDSFSDGGTSATTESALQKARQLLSDGADILDIGGESTRPGALEVPVAEEIARVVPVVEALKSENPSIRISVDTRKGEVARAALAAGADIINDVSGLSFDPSLAEVTGEYDAWLILGHTRGTPEVMRRAENCQYDDIVTDVTDFLRRAAEEAVAAGVRAERIIYDPCLGFAKTAEQDCELLRRIKELRELGPVLIGHSRKSFIGKLTDEPDAKRREAGTTAVSIFSMEQGAEYLRVHDVRAARQALRMWQTLRG